MSRVSKKTIICLLKHEHHPDGERAIFKIKDVAIELSNQVSGVWSIKKVSDYNSGIHLDKSPYEKYMDDFLLSIKSNNKINWLFGE